MKRSDRDGGNARIDYSYNGRDQVSYLGTGVFGGSHIMGASFGYAADGQMNRISRLQNTETTMTFDSNGRIASHVHKYYSGVEIASRHYTYDSMNRLTDYVHGTSGGANTPEDGRGTKFSYYDDGQVKTVWHDGYLNQNPWNQKRDEQFFYDANGNRTRPNDNVGWIVGVGTSGQDLPTGYNNFAYTANNLNQYTTAPGSNPTYDNNGHLASYQGWNYNTNTEAKITQIVGPGGVTMTVHYDPLGRVFRRDSHKGTDLLCRRLLSSHVRSLRLCPYVVPASKPIRSPRSPTTTVSPGS